MKPGDLVLVAFPQADLLAGKLRPALVIAIAPGRHADILLALVTSRVGQAVPQFDELVSLTDGDFAATGLKTASVIRLARLTAVDPIVIHAKLGEIGSDRLASVRLRLISWLKM